MDEARRSVECLARTVGHDNVYVELQRHFHRRRKRAIPQLSKLPARSNSRCSRQTVFVSDPQERELCDVFTAIRNHKTLPPPDGCRRNSERHLKSPQGNAAAFRQPTGSPRNTVELSYGSNSRSRIWETNSPNTRCPEGETMMKHSREGFQHRYGRSEASLKSRPRHD